MKNILLGLCMLLYALGSMSQESDTTRCFDQTRWKNIYYPRDQFTDTFKLFFPRMNVIITSVDLSNMCDEKMQLSCLIADFQKKFRQYRDSFPYMTHYKLRYYPFTDALTKSELDTVNEFFVNKFIPTVRPNPETNECNIWTPAFDIMFRFVHDSVLTDPNLSSKIDKAIAEQTQRDWKRTDYAIYAYQINDSSKYFWKRKSTSDQLILNLYTGIGFNQAGFAGLADVRFGYKFKKYGYQREIQLGYDWSFTFLNDGNRHVNGFLNVDILEDGFLPGLKTLAGFDVGYLVHRQGDLFEKNTVRFGFGFKGDFWYFSPQIYFPGKFKGVYPGLRLLIGV